ncbi:MAG: CvpA family protein [Gammaproteobacteria bacterium]
MNWADYVIVAIVVVSALLGLIRGFVREALSLAGWIGGFVVAAIFVEPGAHLIAPWVHDAQLRVVLAFAGLFALTLIFGLILAHVAGSLVERTGLGPVDRGFGLFFGIVRGYVFVAVLVVLASFTQVPKQPWWQQSKLIPYAQPVAAWIAQHLPRSQLEKKGGQLVKKA